jgi:D-lactate dehydrogenase (cytochrome)
MTKAALHGAAIEAALIDLDGTLLDTAGDLAAAANGMLAELGIAPRDPALIATYIGKGIPKLVHRALTGDMDAEADPALFERAVPIMERRYAQESGRRSAPYPGVHEGLAALRRAQVKLACVTNKAGRFTGELLAQKGLAEFFDVVVSGDALERKKPDPLPYRFACEQLGVATERAVVIGDSRNDIVAGQRAGCAVIAVSYGYNEGRAVADDAPTVVADSFLEAARAIVDTRVPDATGRPASMNALVERLAGIVGADHVLTAADEVEGFAIDWRRKYFGQPLAVVRPKSTEEVAAVVRLCNDTLTAIVPQGGNTGLCGGATPDASRGQVVLSLARMNRVRAVDTANNTMTVEAGCVLANVQSAAREAGRLFPLSLASEGSCAIGGNLSTNAGGTAVLRYGNARELVLGLEVVLPDGTIWDGLRGLRKDNTGYDLKHLFIGAEGTLGVVTAAVLKLFPLPLGNVTWVAALDTPHQAVELLNFMQARCGERLTGFELVSQLCIDLVLRHFPESSAPFQRRYPQYVIAELADTQSAESVRALAESALEAALEKGLLRDAVIATSDAQSKALWSLRENVSEAQAKEGPNIKHDVSLPASAIAAFIETTDAELKRTYPDAQLVTFGHIGDGNLHYNISAPVGADAQQFMAAQDNVNRIVHDSVSRYRGSISAEHGLGQLKRGEILRYKSAVEMEVMRRIKAALDPLGLMNPGKVL